MQYTNNSFLYSGAKGLIRIPLDKTSLLLREKYMQELRERYPCEETLERCEPEEKDMILFFAKGRKIPEYLENKPYALIPEGRLIKVS